MAYDPQDLYYDDERFDDYNPHPYRGGYDIALTYGEPLPPSPSICYSITTSSADPLPPPPPPPKPSDPPPSDGTDRDGSPAPPPTYTGGHWTGIMGLFGFWYVGAGFPGAPEPWHFAADYVFGYLPLYGPKRHDSHNFGNLNYAYEMRRPSSPISVQIDPHPRPDVVEDSRSNGFGLFAHDYDSRVTSIEPSWGEEVPLPVSAEMDPNVEGRFVDDVFGWWPSDIGGAEYHQEKTIEEPGYLCAYGKNSLSMPMTVEVEPSWTYGLHYHEKVVESNCGYERRICEPAEKLSSFDSENFVEQLFGHGREDVSYEARSYEEPSPVEIEPFVPAWSRDSRYREFYQQNCYQESQHANSLLFSSYTWFQETRSIPNVCCLVAIHGSRRQGLYQTENEYSDEYYGHAYWPF